MSRRIMIALLVLLQLAFPVGMAMYRPADEDVIREKGTRYLLALQDRITCRTTGTVDASSSWLMNPDIYEAQGRYAILETDENGYAQIGSFSQKKPGDGAYLLRTEADRIGEYFSLDVPTDLIGELRKTFRQTYYWQYDGEFSEYMLEKTDRSPTLAVEIYVCRGRAALGGLLIDGMSAEEYLALQGEK